jgi:hypothetical protein
MFEGIHDHFASDIVEYKADRLFGTSFLQTKMFLHRRNN